MPLQACRPALEDPDLPELHVFVLFAGREAFVQTLDDIRLPLAELPALGVHLGAQSVDIGIHTGEPLRGLSPHRVKVRLQFWVHPPRPVPTGGFPPAPAFLPSNQTGCRCGQPPAAAVSAGGQSVQHLAVAGSTPAPEQLSARGGRLGQEIRPSRPQDPAAKKAFP